MVSFNLILVMYPVTNSNQLYCFPNFLELLYI